MFIETVIIPLLINIKKLPNKIYNNIKIQFIFKLISIILNLFAKKNNIITNEKIYIKLII
jgi:hypothetical protein